MVFKGEPNPTFIYTLIDSEFAEVIPQGLKVFFFF